MISLLERRLWLSLLMGFLMVGTANMQAYTEYKKDVTWVSHDPTFDEPWFVVNLLLYDNEGKDSFFKHDQAEDGHDGPAIYVDEEYAGSPDWEMAWPGWDNKGNYSDLEKQRSNNEWWGSVYGNDKCVIRFFDPYRLDHGDGYYIRVKMYVFLYTWEVGKSHTVRLRGRWKINNNFDDWVEVTLTSKAFGNPWSAPTAAMTDYQNVSVSGPLPGKVAATTVSLFTQSTTAPNGYQSDNNVFDQWKKYAQSTKDFSGLTGKITRTDYVNAENLPIQYSATYQPAGFIDKNDKKQSTTVFTWFNVDVPGFARPKDVTYETANQWERQGKVSWKAVEKDDNNRKLSTAGKWIVRNVTQNKDLTSKLSYKTDNATFTLDEYKKSENIAVYFVPDNMSEPTGKLSASTTALITPVWAFGSLSATEVADGVQLNWSHNPIDDASGNKPYTLYIQRSTDYVEGSTKAIWTDIATTTIASKSIIDGTYTDQGTGLEANTTYHYRLKMNIFGEDQFCAVATAKLSGSKILTFSASRGTYSSMVKLYWDVQQVGATISNFAIYRRPLGSGDEVNWRSIYTTSGTVSSYSYDDVTALPGSFNEYKVVLWTQQGDERSVNDAKITDGFSVATGIISGNIAYGTGTAVEGAKVTLNRQNADGELTSGLRSVKMLGHGAGFKYDCDKSTLSQLFGGNFSIQMFLNPDSTIASGHDGRFLLTDVFGAFTLYLRYNTSLQAYTPGVYISGKYFDTKLSLKAGAWTQLSCVYDAGKGQTTIFTVDKEGMNSVVMSTNIAVTIRDDDTCISIGNEASFKGEMYYSGNMDEFRFWTKALTEKDIQRNYNHPLAGSETGLAIYYPFDEGLTAQSVAYDFSRQDGISNNRHATTLTPAASSTQLPDKDMMSLMSYTDVNGYYEVRGVPFSGEGTSYSIIPTLGIHEFSPSTRSRYISMSSLNHSGVDFEDVSSFPVSGKVFYVGTDYPVQGANFYVDGVVCSKDGQIIESNEQGEFSISVPIGDHFITVAKSGHVFASGGRYPADPNGVGTKVTFNQEIKNMEFLDSTLVNFTGRIVGGSIEGNKTVGFGLSTNNIGVAEFVLTPLNETPRMNIVKKVSETTYSYETNDKTVSVASATETIASTAWRGAGADDCRKIFVRTDSVTGEFSAMLPPLEYKVSAMKVVKSGLEVGPSQTIDLTNPQMAYTDTLYTDDGSYELYTYNTLLKQTYHSTPTFNVWQDDHDDGAFGIDSYTLKDAMGELVIDDIYTIGADGLPVYKYGGAVFEMYEPYEFNIEAYEEYVNNDGSTPIEFHVPLSDLIVTIDNALSEQQSVYTEDMTVNGEEVKGGQVVNLESNQLMLDSLGFATYKWAAGLPNITEPYTRTITISYDIDNRTYLWSGSGMPGVILGSMPTGNNFVTAGPDMLDMVLRDPPGSKSSAEWTSGTIYTEAHTKAGIWDSDTHITETIKLGAKISTAVGVGVATVTEAESKFDQVIGGQWTVTGQDGDTWGHSVEITKAIATSDDPLFVGAHGDIFIGSATNIIVGNAHNVGFQRVGSSNEVQLGLSEGVTTGLKYSTMFNYTQSYIENMLLPNLETLRNSMLKTVSADTISHYVNTGKYPLYLTTLSPSDPGFGANNTDANGKSVPSSNGNSYTMVLPQNSEENFQDSVMWCNSQIQTWKNYLAMNEREKVKAYENRQDPDSVVCENYSFDSGTRITKTKETQKNNGTHYECQVLEKVVLNGSTGAVTNGIGFIIDVGTSTGGGVNWTDDITNTKKATFAYTLDEDGDADALSVDVYEYGAYSPIFRTRGGQTSGPYEGQTVTKYYEPGTIIMDATMQIEVPQISVDVPVVSDIPSGSAATYSLHLSNASEADVELYYRLMQAEETNPNGAQLFVDGKALTDSRLIKIPAGETVTKLLQLKQTDLSILDYERIGIVMASETQYQVTYAWDAIADTVYISAHYVPSSSPVTLDLSNSVMNTQTGTDLVLTMKDFDRTYRGLKAFRMQYKKQGATDWTQIHEYVLNEADKTSNNELLPATGASVSYRLPMASFSDGNYLFRVVSASMYGAEEVYRYSDETALVKDLQRPTPLGQPEPADGILDIGDELSVTFNEPILKGELTNEANFHITGVLNGAEIAHETALSVPAGTDAASTEAAITLSGKDFSIDTWVNLGATAGTLLSHGKEGSRLTVGTDADNHLVVSINGNAYTGDTTVPTGKWAFLSLSLTANGILNAAIADDANTTQLFKDQSVSPYDGDGPLNVGGGSAAAIHELLLWDEAHDMTTALVNRSKTKNPSTRHLIGYWKMDEGEGTTIRDYARNRHMTMPAETWYLNNENRAVNLDGQSFLSIDASALPTCVDDDYALEFWMRGGQQTGEAQLLQMGEVALSLSADGILQLESNNTKFSALGAQLTDNTWHHIALNVLRQGFAAVYIDGQRSLTTQADNIGSIATNRLIIGARRTLTDVVYGTYAYDHPFTGQVDEVRVWNATLNGSLLASNRKVRLTGSEDGLVAYYPFERKTLDEGNQVVTIGDAADLCSGNLQAELSTLNVNPSPLNYTDDAPALKTKPTETNVSFSFVASDEKVVITLNEDAATIEGCTLNFTVRDVRDENGNYSVPAVWSAFVNCNELAWAENSINCVANATAGTTIAATIINKSGSQQMWTLSGMPAWLTATADNGTTNPLQETSVTFTVCPATPVGKYEETIYLKGNNGIETPLTLSITVTGEVPAWAVNPNDFETSMNVIARVERNGSVLSDEDDIVAAFIGDECRGTAHPAYVARYDSYFITMDIYGNTGETGNIIFRAYDAGSGIVYPVIEPDRTISFEPLALEGRYEAPVVLTISDLLEQSTDLKAGWNWFSLYVKPADMSTANVLKNIAPDVLAIKSQNSWLMPDNQGNLTGSMNDSLNNVEMYAVQMKTPRTLRIVGEPVDPAKTPITLAKGWNWTGYYMSQVSSLADAFAGMTPIAGDIVKGQYGISYYNDYEWTGSLLLMQPGAGYMVNVSETHEYSYPGTPTAAPARSTTVSSTPKASHQTVRTFTHIDYHTYAGNAIMAARVVFNGQPVSHVELAVFAGDECRTATVTDDNGIAYLTIPGDDDAMLTFYLVASGEIVRAAESTAFNPDAVIGTLSIPFVIDLGMATGIYDLQIKDSQLKDDSWYDLSGRKITTSRSSNRKLPKGIYIINGEKKVVK